MEHFEAMGIPEESIANAAQSINHCAGCGLPIVLVKPPCASSKNDANQSCLPFHDSFPSLQAASTQYFSLELAYFYYSRY